MFKTAQISPDFGVNESIVFHNGDTKNLLAQIPDNTISLVITSPPYNLGKEYEMETDLNTYIQSFDGIIAELVRVLENNGSICWEVGNYIKKGEVFPLDVYFYNLFLTHNLKLRNRIIWQFGHGLHASKRFSGRYETILWFTKSDKYKFNLDAVRIPSKYPGKRHFKGPKAGQPSCNPLGKNPSDIWKFVALDWEKEIWDIPNVKSNHPEKTAHPCQFPIELVERCVLALTDEKDWIFDPFAGVASALIGAIHQGRRAIGAEKEKKYYDIGLKRIYSFFDGSLKIRPIGKRIFEPTGREKVSQIPMEWRNQR